MAVVWALIAIFALVGVIYGVSLLTQRRELENRRRGAEGRKERRKLRPGRHKDHHDGP